MRGGLEERLDGGDDGNGADDANANSDFDGDGDGDGDDKNGAFDRLRLNRAAFPLHLLHDQRTGLPHIGEYNRVLSHSALRIANSITGRQVRADDNGPEPAQRCSQQGVRAVVRDDQIIALAEHGKVDDGISRITIARITAGMRKRDLPR